MLLNFHVGYIKNRFKASGLLRL